MYEHKLTNFFEGQVSLIMRHLNEYLLTTSETWHSEEFLMFCRFESEARLTLTHHQHDQVGILQDVLQMLQTFM